MVILDRFDIFSIIGNRNEYSTKQIQNMSFQANYVFTPPGKTKNSTKTAAHYCNAFCGTDCSRLSQKVVQCSFLSLLVFVRKFLQQFSDRKSITFSSVLLKIYLQTRYG